MLVKLGESKFVGEMIDRATVKEMVKAYRKRTEILNAPLLYSHFGIEELFKFLIANRVISKGALDHINIPAAEDGEGFGLKIYLANHNKIENCPSERSDAYLEKDTTILCTTVIKDAKKYQYRDQLKDDKDSILISAADAAGGGFDQTSTYPPDNPFESQTDATPKDETLDIGEAI